MLSCLPSDLLLRLIQLSVFPGTFNTSAATEVLGVSGCPSLVEGLMRRVSRLGLGGHDHCTDGWRLHLAVRLHCQELSTHLSLPLMAARQD